MCMMFIYCFFIVRVFLIKEIVAIALNVSPILNALLFQTHFDNEGKIEIEQSF